MATAARPLTYDDLVDIPREREGDRHEIIDGVLVVTPSPIPLHRIASDDLFVRFHTFLRPRRLGPVIATPIDVVFAPDQVAIPDLDFVRQDRLDVIGPNAIEGAPDLPVEILSQSTHAWDWTKKMELYARLGVREHWIADPVARTIEVHLLTGGRYAPMPNVGGMPTQPC